MCIPCLQTPISASCSCSSIALPGVHTADQSANLCSLISFAQYSYDSVPACLQTSARDAEKLPNNIHIGCYTINTQPVKAAIERQMKELQEELLASLRRKVMPQFFHLAYAMVHHTQLMLLDRCLCDYCIMAC